MHTRSNYTRDRGFTLLEILVVVVIIAVMTTVAMLSVTGMLGKDRELDAEGDRFTDVAAAAVEQAQLEGRDYGIWFGPSRYEVMAYTAARQHWDAVPDDRLYEEHDFPSGVIATLEMEGKSVPIDLAKADAERVPQLILFSSGDASPYHLKLARDGTELAWEVDGQADGTLVVTRPGMQQ